MPNREEHSIVTASKNIIREGERVKKGTKGAIVHIYKDKQAYVVEFDDNKVITVYEHELEG